MSWTPPVAIISAGAKLSDVAYDRTSRHLYMLELFADEARPVARVWEVG